MSQASGFVEELFMPAISTSTLSGTTASSVIGAYNDVRTGPRHGIRKERDSGVISITMDRNPPYAGVTEFRPVYTETGVEPRAVRIGISDSIPRSLTLTTGETINYTRRVTRHEAKHALSEKLLEHMDVSPRMATLLMESFAEYTELKDGQKKEVLATTPYQGALKFGYMVDMFYNSRQNGKGFSAFVADIQDYRSAKSALTNLGRNIKEAVDRGVDVRGAVEGRYRSDLREVSQRRKAA